MAHRCEYCGCDDRGQSTVDHRAGACVECPVDPMLVAVYRQLIEARQ